MLATCSVMGWPLEGYIEQTHPCQLAVTEALAEKLGLDLSAAPSGIDGCGLTTYGTTLLAIARAFAAGGADPAFRRTPGAMAGFPFLIGGTGRFDPALLGASGYLVPAQMG